MSRVTGQIVRGGNILVPRSPRSPRPRGKAWALGTSNGRSKYMDRQFWLIDACPYTCYSIYCIQSASHLIIQCLSLQIPEAFHATALRKGIGSWHENYGSMIEALGICLSLLPAE